MTAVSFSAPNLLPPYQEIIAGGSKDWVIYTLISSEGKNELKLVDSGDGGLESLEEEFSGSKVMWAFVRVKDSNSGLGKFVLINWLGDGVPDSRKGLFPSHSEAVAKFLKGYHVSINARSDGDVEPSHIRKRVADSSGSNYSVHNEPAQKYRAPAAVTSSYVPIGRPTIVQSRAVPPPTAVGTDYTSKKDELAEIRKTQESLVGARSTPPPVVPSVSRPTPTIQKPAFIAPTPAPPAPASAPASERPAAVGTSYTPISLGRPGKLGNRWGQAQADEAAEKSAAPTSTAPAAASSKPLTWSERQALAKTQREQDEAASAAASQRSVVTPPVVRSPPPPAAPAAPPMPARIVAPAPVEAEPEVELEPEAEPEPIDDSPPPPPLAPTPPPYVAAGSTKTESAPEPAPVRPAMIIPTAGLAGLSLKSTPAPAPTPAPSSGPRARVLFEYAKDEDNEMKLVEGEILTEIEMVDEGWWSAVGDNGAKRGLFPANYVELIEDGEESAPPAPAHEEPEAEEEAAPEPAAASDGPSATALYDYAADEEGELTFAEGDHITAIEFSSDTWWSGTAPDGTSGVFPSNYVELRE